MIVNAYSILMIFMAGLGVALAGATGIAGAVGAVRIRRSRDERSVSHADRMVHLATLSTVTCIAVLVAGWPLLYAMLNSFVPEIPGAMCIYGVTRVMPTLTLVIQVAAPAILFLFGGWLLLDYARRRSGRPIRNTAGMWSLVALSTLMATLEGTTIYYVLHAESLNHVSCCSSYGEGTSANLQTPSYYLPWHVTDRAGEFKVMSTFYGGVGLLAVWLTWLWWRGLPARRMVGAVHAILLLTAALAATWISLVAFAEVLSPKLMALPFHHCLYCLIGNGRVPDAPIIITNLAAGIFVAGWVALLGFFTGSRPDRPERLSRRLCAIGAVTLLACLLMVVVHLEVT